MESLAVECGEAGNFARGCGTGKTRARYPGTQQDNTNEKKRARANARCSRGLDSYRSKSRRRKIQLVFGNKQEKDPAKEGIHDDQIEIKSCSTSYLDKKIACHWWRLDASCC